MRDERIEDVLAGLGLVGPAAARARAALDEAGITNPRKERVSVGKRERLEAAIAERYARFCETCAGRTDPGGREVVIVARDACERCRGSDNTRALDEAAEACAAAGVRRVVVVGGSAATRDELAALGGRLDLRLVDGIGRRTKSDARSDVEWAQVVLLCGSTELAHKVSTLYTDDPAVKGKLVRSSRRGVAAIAGELAQHARLRAAIRR